jgi:thioredoxin-related protein
VLGACEPKEPEPIAAEAIASDNASEQVQEAPEPPPPVYEELDLAQAKTKAAKEGKTIMVMFASPNCPACASMDRIMNSKPARTLLEALTVPIRMDTTKHQFMALGYGVRGTPTIVFLGPDQIEIDRFMGAVPEDVFVSYVREFAVGNDRVHVARREMLRAHVSLARLLVDKGKIEEGLAEYLWALDRRQAGSGELFDEIAPSLVGGLVELAEEYPAVERALNQRVEAARRRLQTEKLDMTDFKLVSNVNRYRGYLEQTLAVYDSVREESSDPKLRAALTEEAFDALLAAGRYDVLDADLELERAAEEFRRRAVRYKPDAEADQSSGAGGARSWYEDYVARGVCNYYQALRGLERDESAAELAEWLEREAPGHRTLNALAWAGYLSGRPTRSDLARAREAHRLTYGGDAAVADTLARILAAGGQREEALKVLEECMSYVSGEYRALLQECYDEISGESSDPTPVAEAAPPAPA